METTWWQITIVTNPDLEDIVFWLLQNFGCQGMAVAQTDRMVISAYVTTEARSETEVGDFAQGLARDYGIREVQWQTVPEEDWSSSWKQHWQPDPIGENLIIYPAWVEVPPSLERRVIRLDPGSAFGSGAHPTTRMCLEALENLVSNQTKTIVDLGCGSGILGIAAHRLGVGYIYSTDIDPLALKATRHNWELNQFDPDRLVICQGSLAELLEHLPHPVEGFTCNILAEPILGMIPDFAQLGQWGILSGFLFEQCPVITTSLQAHGWAIQQVLRQEQWACLVVTYSGMGDNKLTLLKLGCGT